MIKVLINEEEVVSNSNLQIKEEMLSTSSTILKNCYPKSWENDKDYVSRYYYPKDYSKCKIYNLPRENTTQEQTGTNLSFETYIGKSTLEDIKFYGNTLQNGTPTPSSPVEIQSVTGLQNVEVCGKNLFNANGNNITYTNQNVTKNIIDSNKIEITSTYSWARLLTNIKNLKPNSTYTISTDITNINSRSCGLYKNSSNRDIKTDANFKSTLTLQSNSSGVIEFAFYVNYSGTTTITDTITFSNIQLEQGSATEYEPYKGNTYEVNLGKNLIYTSPKTNLGIEFTYNSNTGETSISGTASSTYAVAQNIQCNLPPGTYTLSIQNTYNFSIGIGIYINGTRTPKPIISGNKSLTFTTNGTITQYDIYITSLTTGENYSATFKLQLEKGSIATSFSPYFTPIELNKIGTYQDRIYKDNGKWYVEKNTRKLELAIADMDNNDNFPGWKNQTQLKKDWPNINTQYLYNIGFKYLSSISVQPSSGYDTLGMNTASGSGAIYLNKNYFSLTQTQWKKQYPNLVVTIMYALATPEYTEITNEELISQLESLNIELYEGQTNFIIDGSLPMPTYIKIYNNFEELIFCGFTKNTGNVSLNPRHFHGVDLQILDFKDLLSTGETLNYVIANKTITEAINQVVSSISNYGFIVGNIQLLNPDEIIGAYSTLNKTAYDVFQYFADITQSRWTTRMIDENTIAIDFYDPTLMPQGTQIQSTTEFYENNDIVDISFNYSTNDYRNKQIMTSDEVFANITQTETIIADGYATSFMCQNKIGIIRSITLNGVEQSFITKNEGQLGYSGDFIYQPGENTFISTSTISAGGIIVITYYPIVKGREIILNSNESGRIETQIGRKGIISRYENRNDSTSSQELQKIGQSYIKYKGKAEITLKIVSTKDIWNIGQIVNYNAPLEELTTDYMVKSKSIDMYLNAGKIFYTYELTSNFNYENAVNYFDNQRAKNQGNIGEGETITRNIDLDNEALILFYDTEINETQVQNSTSLDFALDGVLI